MSSREKKQAADVENEAASSGLAMTWREIMEEMDPEAGAVYHKDVRLVHTRRSSLCSPVPRSFLKLTPKSHFHPET